MQSNGGFAALARHNMFQFPQPPRLTNSRHCATLVQRPSSSMQAATQQQKQNGPRVTSPNSKSQASPISAISNRYNKLLEFRVTNTKQTTGLSSNRYKNAAFSGRVFDVLGSEKCLI